MQSARTRIFVADDFLPVRRRLIEFLTAVHGVDVVGEAETPAEAIGAILEAQPDWVILDYQLRGGTGVDVLRAVHPKAPSIRFIVLTNHPTPQYRRACTESGAGWFFDKTTEFGKIRDVIDGSFAANGPLAANC